MKVFHCADLHYCPKHLAWVDLAFSTAIDRAIADGCELAIIAGDSFDASMGIHEPAVSAYLRQISRLGNAMPVCVLQGTYSHDRPGSLDMLKEIGDITAHPIWVADKPQRMALIRTPGGLVWDDDLPDDIDKSHIEVIVCALPSLNKADPAIMEQGAAAWTYRAMRRWAHFNAYARQLCIPTVLVTHGTVVGSLTESNFAMVSPDHEFPLEVLLAADCDAVMLGHIHKHQMWRDRTPSMAWCRIAYPGSIARLTFGHTDPVGFLIWDVSTGRTDMKFIKVPSRQLIDITFAGPPDMDDLKDLATTVSEIDSVRIRWSVDQEHAHIIDKPAIRALFAGAADLKLEGTVNPIQSVRAKGISHAYTLEEKLALWAETTGDRTSVEGMHDRLNRLRSEDVDAIVRQLVAIGSDAMREAV